MDNANLSLTIKANDEASASLAGVGEQVQSVTQSIARLDETAMAGGEGGGFAGVAQGIHETGAEAEKSSGPLGGLTESLGGLKSMALGFVAGGIFMQLAGGIEGFVSGASEKMGELGSETFKLMSVTGQSAETTSALLAAFEKFGIGVKEAATSLGLFEKGLNGVDVALEDGSKPPKTFSAALGELGLSAKDAGGNVKPMAAVLGEVADAFAKMPDGANKTAIAMSLFGRAGKDMIPVLDLGKEGMAEMEAEAGKLGLTLSGENVAQIRQYSLAQKQMAEAVGGLQLQLGLALLPALLAVATAVANGAVEFNEVLRPAITAVVSPVADLVNWISQSSVALSVLAAIAAPLAAIWVVNTAAMVAMTVATTAQTVATGVMTAAQTLLDIALTANPVGLIVLGIVALIAALVTAYKTSDTFRAVVDSAFGFIKGQVENLVLIFNVLKGAVEAVLGAISSVIQKIPQIPGVNIGVGGVSVTPGQVAGAVGGTGASSLSGNAVTVNQHFYGQHDPVSVQNASRQGVTSALYSMGVR